MIFQSKEEISNYIAEKSFDTKSRTTAKHNIHVDEFSELVFKILLTIRNYYEKFSDESIAGNERQVSSNLIIKSTNSLMAAFELSLNGYYWEPPILLRTALEGFCVAWDICQNPNRFKAYQEGKKFDSTKSISNVKKEAAFVGKFNGHLSNNIVHISRFNGSPMCVTVDGSPQIQTFGFLPTGKEENASTNLYISVLTTFFCLQLTEIIFGKYSDELETLEMTGTSGIANNKVSERHRKYVSKMETHFTEMVKDPKKFT
jgi:hypothetical protein